MGTHPLIINICKTGFHCLDGNILVKLETKAKIWFKGCCCCCYHYRCTYNSLDNTSLHVPSTVKHRKHQSSQECFVIWNLRIRHSPLLNLKLPLVWALLTQDNYIQALCLLTLVSHIQIYLN